MHKLKEDKISSQVIFSGKILEVRLDRVLLPNGKEAAREVVGHPGAVAVVAVTPDDEVILVRQYRYPVDEILLELPAGKIDKGEEPELCAIRELEEETGYRAQKLEKLTSIVTTPGFSDEVLHIYLAKELEKTAQMLDNDEFLNVEFYTWPKVREMIAANVIKDSKTIVGLLMAGC